QRLGITAKQRWSKAETHDAEAWRFTHLKIISVPQQCRQVLSEFDVPFDRGAVAGEAIVAERHPNFERSKAPSLLKAKFAEPRQSPDSLRVPVCSQIRWNEAERRSHHCRVAYDYQACF